VIGFAKSGEGLKEASVQRLGPVAQLLGLGSYLATCIAGGPIAGYFVDRWLQTQPVFTLVGLLLGLVVAFVGSYRMITQTLRAMEREVSRQQNKKRK
jgi:F0F1-type ATP synthase assembly protein I